MTKITRNIIHNKKYVKYTNQHLNIKQYKPFQSQHKIISSFDHNENSTKTNKHPTHYNNNNIDERQ